MLGLAHHERQQYGIGIRLLGEDLYLVEQGVFVAYQREELELYGACHLREVFGHEVLGGVAEVDDLLGIEETGQFQLLLDFLYLIGGQCREEDGIVAVGLTLDDTLVVEVFQDFSHIIIYRCTLEEIVDILLARCHTVVVGNVVEGIEQQHALKHGKVVCPLCLHRQVMGVEAFGHGPKACSVSLEVLLHIVP